jgi:hypothetical protein
MKRILIGISGLVVVLTVMLVARTEWPRVGKGKGLNEMSSSRRVAMSLRLYDTSQRHLSSLFEGLPVDPRYSKYLHVPELRSCSKGQGKMPRASSKLDRILALFGLSFSTPVQAQNGCDCYERAIEVNCNPYCGGRYWGGQAEPSTQSFTWDYVGCTGGEACDGSEAYPFGCDCGLPGG